MTEPTEPESFPPGSTPLTRLFLALAEILNDPDVQEVIESHSDGRDSEVIETLMHLRDLIAEGEKGETPSPVEKALPDTWDQFPETTVTPSFTGWTRLSLTSDDVQRLFRGELPVPKGVATLPEITQALRDTFRLSDEEVRRLLGLGSTDILQIRRLKRKVRPGRHQSRQVPVEAL